MGKENLSVVCSQEAVQPELHHKSRYDLGKYLPGFRVTGVWIKRPAKLYSFEETDLFKAFIRDDLALEVVALDPEGIIRLQIFQCNNPETQAMVGYTYTGSSKEQRHFFLKQTVHPVDPKMG